MPRDSSASLVDVLDAIHAIHEYTRGLTREDFGRDRKTVDAVVRNLEVIGEAVKQLPADMRAAHADVEWQKIPGLPSDRFAQIRSLRQSGSSPRVRAVGAGAVPNVLAGLERSLTVRAVDEGQVSPLRMQIYVNGHGWLARQL